MFENKTRFGNNFHFNSRITKDLTSDIVYTFQCGLCNECYYGECVRHFNVRIGEHIGISPLTKKQVQSKNTCVANHLLFCNYSASYDNLYILTHENKKFLPELKESLLIMNRNFTLALILQTLVIKIFVRSLVAFNSCYVIPIEWTFYYFAIVQVHEILCSC